MSALSIDGAVRVAAADAFDEGGDDVVVLFAVLVVEGDVLLQAVDDRLVVDHDLRRIVREGGDHDFQHVEQPARIAAAETEDRFLFLEGDIPGFQVVISLDGTLQKRFQVAHFHAA